MSRHSYFRKSAPRPSFNRFAMLPPSQKWIARAAEAGVPFTREAIDAFRRECQR